MLCMRRGHTHVQTLAKGDIIIVLISIITLAKSGVVELTLYKKKLEQHILESPFPPSYFTHYGKTATSDRQTVRRTDQGYTAYIPYVSRQKMTTL